MLIKIKTIVCIVAGVLIMFVNASAQKKSSALFCKSIAEIEKDAHANKVVQQSTMTVNNYDLIYHQCYWQIDPSINYIKGQITTYFKPTVAGFDQIEFDLTNELNVDSVKYHDTLMSFSQSTTDILSINFPATIPLNELDSVIVYYKGEPPISGFGSFVQAEHNGKPIIWTLSAPYGAKDWWPCKQNLVDKIDSIDIIVEVPQGNKVGSNGKLIAELTSGNNTIFHWKSRYPIAAYLVALAVTNYASYSNYVPLQNGSLEVLNYVYPEYLSTSQSQTPDIINIIKLYDSLIVEYPFAKEKYGHAQFSWGGGMEHQTMSFMQGFEFDLMAHECAHQWFGDYITCGSWEDVWLNEGFATYFEGLTVQRYFPGNWMYWKQSKLDNITSESGGSVLCDDTTQVDRIFDGRLTYDKGGYLLHMLRWKLGDTLFFKGLKNYLNDPLLKTNYAKTPALKAHLEAASGQDLTVFFNQWYYKQGYPSYQLDWSQSNNVVSLTVNQTQSHSSVSFFEMPISVKFSGENEDTTIIFNHTYSGQVFTANINFAIESVVFDPELWIISGNNLVLNTRNHSHVKYPLTLYPNPSKNNLTIDGLNSDIAVNRVQLVDVLGKVVYDETGNYKAMSKLTINTEILKTGLYSVLLYTSTGSISLRFVKE